MARAGDTVREDPLVKVHEQLTAAVAELTNSAGWLRMLRVASALPQYSASNVILIALQRSDATHVQGLRAWNALGRRVRKGERGIAILAPCLYKSRQDVGVEGVASGELAAAPKDDVAPRALRGFRVVHVFDIAQTEGEPLPEVGPALLHGPAPHRLWECLARVVESDGFELQRGDCEGANAFTRFDDRVIRVRDDVEPAQASKSLAHELAHVRAEHETRFVAGYGRPIECRGVAEVEAESITYLVASAAGLDASGYTVPYVAGWSGGNLELLKDTATRVLSVSRSIVDEAGIDPAHPDGAAQPTPLAQPRRAGGRADLASLAAPEGLEWGRPAI